MANDKIYAKGIFIKEKTVKGKQLLSISFNVEKLAEFLHEHQNEKGYVSVDAWRNDQEDKFGNTHTIYLNTYKKEGSAAPASSVKPARNQQEDEDASEISDLPF